LVRLDATYYYRLNLRYANSQERQKYGILLILTDGVINDFEFTKQAIIEASHFPLSIIIIGIGAANFDDMHDLDSDHRLLSANGKTAVRDIVQFVA
jgi:copine 5/8/9